MRDFKGLTDQELYERLDAIAFEAEALRREIVERGRAKAKAQRAQGDHYGPYGYGTQER